MSGTRPKPLVVTGLTRDIETTLGTIRGVEIEDLNVFLGVRYGVPPKAKKRFMPAEKPTPIARSKGSGSYGATAVQLSPMEMEIDFPRMVGAAFAQLINSREDKIREDEDCLNLNVWTRGLDNKKRPVIVMLHGGAFNYGSSAGNSCNGFNLAYDNDVVVVSLNHRLNVLGFLSLAEIGDERYADSGNVGMLDIVLALEWVRDNIVEFGGDPGNVTICGQSGGGQKVSTLMAMPAAKGLFHKAIVQSGPGLRVGTMKKGTENAWHVLNNLNITEKTLYKIHEVPVEKLIEAARFARQGDLHTLLQWRPVLDGVNIVDHPFDPEPNSLCNDVPLLIGMTKDEGVGYAVAMSWWGKLTEEKMIALAEKQYGDKALPLIKAYREIFPDYDDNYIYSQVIASKHYTADTFAMAEAKSKQNAPVYSYMFSWESPVENGILKAAHSVEVPFTFNLLDRAPIMVGDAPETAELGRKVTNAWVEFMRTGNPNTADLPEWPTYNAETRATMELNHDFKVRNDLFSQVRKIFQENNDT